GHPRRGRTPPQTHRPRHQDAVAVVVRPRRTRSGPRVAFLPTPLRHRAHLPVRQEHPRLDRTIDLHTRTSRPLDRSRRRRAHPTPPRPPPRRRPPTPLGTTARPHPTHPRPRPTRV